MIADTGKSPFRIVGLNLFKGEVRGNDRGAVIQNTVIQTHEQLGNDEIGIAFRSQVINNQQIASLNLFI